MKTINIGKLTLGFDFAKTWLWGTTTGDEERTYFFQIGTVKKNDNTALSLIILPVTIMIHYG